jgi:hypothetical protein
VNIANTIPATGAKVRRDENTHTLFFNTVKRDSASGDAIVYQYWMEDPVLSRQKYGWAREQGLAGVGPYVLHNLDLVHQPEESQAMWSTFDSVLLGRDAMTDQRTKVD